METALTLLDVAPEDQVVRIQIAYKAITSGQWADAASSLRNAARESDGKFAADCEALARHCDNQLKR